MPNNLPLAVKIADFASHTTLSSDDELFAAAEQLTQEHPEADASVEQVAEVLREESSASA